VLRIVARVVATRVVTAKELFKQLKDHCVHIARAHTLPTIVMQSRTAVKLLRRKSFVLIA